MKLYREFDKLRQPSSIKEVFISKNISTKINKTFV